MPNRELRRLIGALAMLTFFALVGLFETDLLQMGGLPAGGRTAAGFHYAWQVGLWLALAMTTVALVDLIFWRGIVARALGRDAPNLPKVAVAAIIYLVAMTAIVGGVFKQPVIGFWTTSSVVGLVLGFALRNIFVDIFTGLAIHVDQSYSIGDFVRIPLPAGAGTVTGKVADIHWRTTLIETEEGTVVIVPNGQMGMVAVTNYSRPTHVSRFETEVCIDFAVPTERARRVLLAAARSLVGENGFDADREPQVLIDEIGESGNRYKVRYWIHPWDPMSPTRARDRVNTAILGHLRHAGISPAYPKEDLFQATMPERNLDPKDPRNLKRLVGGLELFESLEPGEIESLISTMRPVHVPEGRRLIGQGDPGDSMFVLAEGLLHVHVNGADGGNGSVRVGSIRPGEFFGEMSLLTGEPRSATVVAASESHAYEIGKDAMRQLLTARPAIAQCLSEAVARRRAKTGQALADAQAGAANLPATDGLARTILNKILNLFGLKQPR